MKQFNAIVALILIVLLSSLVYPQTIYDEFSQNLIHDEFTVEQTQFQSNTNTQQETIVYNQFDVNQQAVPQAPAQPTVYNQFNVQQQAVPQIQQPVQVQVYDQFNLEQYMFQPFVQQEPQPSQPTVYNQFDVNQQVVPQIQEETQQIQPTQPTNTFFVSQQTVPQFEEPVEPQEPTIYNQFNVNQQVVPQPTQPQTVTTTNTFFVSQQQSPQFAEPEQQQPAQPTNTFFVTQQVVQTQQPTQSQPETFVVKQTVQQVTVVEPVSQEQFLVEQETQQPVQESETQPETFVVEVLEESQPTQTQQPTNQNEQFLVEQPSQSSQPEQIVVIQTTSPSFANNEQIVVEQTEPVVETNTFDVYIDQRDINIYACIPYTERVVVHNTGSVSQTFTITIDDEQLAEWTTISPQSFTLPANEAQEVLISINSPCEYEGLKDYDLRIESEDAIAVIERDLGVFLQQNLQAIVYDVNKTSCPGIEQQYNYTIYNSGTFTETYTVSISDYETQANLGANQITLAPNQTYQGFFTLKFADSKHGVKDFEFYVETERTQLIGVVPVTYTIDACYDFTMEVQDVQTCNNDVASSSIFLESQSDVELKIDIASQVPDFTVVDFNYVELPPRGNVTIPITFDPYFVDEKTYDLSFTATEQYANLVAEKSTHLNVTQCYAYETVVADTFEVCPIAQTIPVSVVNYGISNESFVVNAVLDESYAQDVTLSQNNITLAPGEERVITLYLNGSQLPPNTNIPVTIETQFLSTSKMDRTQTIQLQTKDTEYCFGLSVSHKSIDANNTPTQHDFWFTNNGILNTSYDISTITPNWMIPLTNEITLSPGETKPVSFIVAPNTSVDNTSFAFFVNADAHNIRQDFVFEVDVNPSNKAILLLFLILVGLGLFMLAIAFAPTFIPLALLLALIGGLFMVPTFVDTTVDENQTIGGEQVTVNFTSNQTYVPDAPFEDEEDEQEEEEEDEREEVIFCPADIRTCDDGTNVTRDHENNCEFNSCPEDRFAWFTNLFKKDSVCADDTFECSQGVFVIRNEADECRFYACPGDVYYYNETIHVTIINETVEVVEDPNVYYAPQPLVKRVSNWLDRSNNSCNKDMFECAPGVYSIRDPSQGCSFHACPGDVFYYNETIALLYDNTSINSESDLDRLINALDENSRVIYIEPNGTEVIDLHAYFTDPDGDSLTYSINTSNVENYAFIVEDNLVTILPDTGYTGVEVITVTADDGNLTTTSPNLYLATVPKEYQPDYKEPLDTRLIILLVVLLIIIFAIIIYMDVTMLKKSSK